MDMLVAATNGTMPSTAHFAAGTAFDCNTATSPKPSPCLYASLNGFNSSVSQSNANSGTLGNNVYVDFPAASSVNLSSLNLPGASVAATPLIRVTAVNNVTTWFAALLKGMTKQRAAAQAICGVIQATSPIPILVLHPTLQQSFSVQGNPNISIVGGPNKSIQVNSCSATGGSSPCANNIAANVGGSATVNLCAAGPNYCGSAMGVWGSETIAQAGTGFITSCAGKRPPGAPACTASQAIPQWNSPSPPIADPFATTSAPSIPSIVRAGTPGAPYQTVGLNVNGCPVASCDEYGPGYYPGGIVVKNTTAIFDPGIYYVGGNAATSQQCNNSGSKGSFCSGPNSCIRPSTAVGDGSGGTIFYFADTNSVNVGANAGCSGVPVFNTTTGTGSLANGVKCTAASQVPANLPASLSGSVLLGPCQKPTVNALCASANANANCNLNFGDPLGTNDPIGEQRGILFFQNRAVNAGNNPGWSGGGDTLLAGTMYFHQCVTSGSDTGVGCVSGAFNDQMNLFGNPGSSTYVLGDIVIDQLKLGGGGSIVMDLNPSAAATTLKAALVQ